MNDLLELGSVLTKDEPYKGTSSPMAPPIYQTSLFTFPDVKSIENAMEDELNSNLYSRGNNPTVQEVEKKVAFLEKADKAKLMSAGVSAIAASIMGFVKHGDHIICTNDSYGWAQYICGTYLSRFGVEVSFIDGCNLEELKKTIRRNTKLIYLESPSSITFRVLDLRKIATIAQDNNLKTVIDNTWATPLFQNPIEFGIDLVVHSASKYLGGHSDIIGGIVVGSNADISHIFNTEFLPLGTVPDPFQAWLILRGMRTLRVRLAEHHKTAMHITDFLNEHKAVERVFYPMHPSHDQYELAKEQMSGGPGLLSIKLKDKDPSHISTMVESLKNFHIGVSWGGYESLVFPVLATKKGDPSMVRLHLGLEEPELLIADLDQAFHKMK